MISSIIARPLGWSARSNAAHTLDGRGGPRRAAEPPEARRAGQALHGLAMGDESYRMLDFGCGDGGFTTKILVQSQWLPERLWLAIVEPDVTYRQQAVDRLQAFTPHPVQAWPALPPHLNACFELILQIMSCIMSATSKARCQLSSMP